MHNGEPSICDYNPVVGLTVYDADVRLLTDDEREKVSAWMQYALTRSVEEVLAVRRAREDAERPPWLTPGAPGPTL